MDLMFMECRSVKYSYATKKIFINYYLSLAFVCDKHIHGPQWDQVHVSSMIQQKHIINYHKQMKKS